METKNKILVVDDDLAILKFTCVSLSLAGYEVFTTTDGKEAIKLVDSKKPDVMVLDLVMFPMLGFEVLESVRCFSEVPVIVFSARSDFAAKALKEGANEFIAKPFRPEQLIQKIQDILALTKPACKLPFNAFSSVL